MVLQAEVQAEEASSPLVAGAAAGSSTHHNWVQTAGAGPSSQLLVLGGLAVALLEGRGSADSLSSAAAPAGEEVQKGTAAEADDSHLLVVALV